ncbi:GAF domain-containing protein [Pseudonocardia acidicola]|uniref:HTH luxR-type domain-containing protein n=1 Tax=Pseudonocardia acidicola TaxID=2724939 RepID=A0ABX1S3M1_9PSEU|nr:GAF domain-containing protein [Pseudonocardia acidicola]NMH96158.1 hypothetical protein [Pseudonocardia acidicola]
MARGTKDPWAVLLGVGQIVAAPAGSVAERAQALLEPLYQLVPFAAHWVGLRDPDTQMFGPLATEGLDERTLRHLEGPGLVCDVELVGLRPVRPAICNRDFPVPPQEVPTWAEYLEPAGFHDVLVVGLFTADGRLVGGIGLNTDTSPHPTDAARDLIGLLTPAIAAGLDPTRTVAAAARAVRGALGGGVLSRAGAVVPLTGLPGHRLLDRGSALLAVVARLVEGGAQYAAFLCPDRDTGVPVLRRITVLSCGDAPPHFLRAAIVVSEDRVLHGLTVTELQVLGMLVDEWADERIAAGLGASRYQLADHIDRACWGLGAPDRGVALARAFNQGLYIPPGLGDLHNGERR